MESHFSKEDFTQSAFKTWKPPFPLVSEPDILGAYKSEWHRQIAKTSTRQELDQQRQIKIIDIEEFEIYRSPKAAVKTRHYELIALHLLDIPTSKRACIDAVVSIGRHKHYVQGLDLQNFSIEGYGDDDDPRVFVYIQSALAKEDRKYDIWYRLGTPSSVYQKFHHPFLWVAQFGKHVLDYLEAHQERPTGLENFRIDFASWLVKRFRCSDTFRHWYRNFGPRKDFRVAVNAYIGYLYGQAYNIDSGQKILAHPLWADCRVKGLRAVEIEPTTTKNTIATPFVYEAFKSMYFGSHIQSTSFSSRVEAARKRQMSRLGFAKLAFQGDTPKKTKSGSKQCRSYGQRVIQVGDVVAFDPRQDDRTLWRNANWSWYAYVQHIEPRRDGVLRLFVHYLYRPQETNIYNAKYPYDNELFFSDNCNCQEGQLLSTDINGQIDVTWTPTVLPTKGYFVRQTYKTQESSFITFEDSHKTCDCKKQKSPAIHGVERGDTVYLVKKRQGKEVLEPVVVASVNKEAKLVSVRRLLRLKRDLGSLLQPNRRPSIAANELVLTDIYEDVSNTYIRRHCSIKFVEKNDVLQGRLPFGYDRGGAGDLWFISMGLTKRNGASTLVYLTRLPTTIKQGQNLDHKASTSRMKGLSLFSGGGNLDRGLGEGAEVDIHTTIDFSEAAIHTQRVNARDPSKVRFFCGSVDEYLKLRCTGEDHHLIAQIGDINIIMAGSPCPGYSSLQQHMLSDQSLRNASHVSTFCSSVDLYRPEYAILENVVNMSATRKGIEINVLSQVVACLVSMGYQVNQYIMDSWSYGSGQRRSRLFLTIAAPGFVPIVQPEHTYSRPREDTMARSLGTLPNGERFGGREYYATPFDFVSASEVTADLPNIGNGIVQTCLSHPDHRLSALPNAADRALLQYIPRDPPGFGYKAANELGLVPKNLQRPGKEAGKSFTRIMRDGLIPTITTRLSPSDSRNGASIHWDEPRPVTIMDARRAQGWLDHEVIVGNPLEQYCIVGNGVDRKVSFALGLALREALRKNRQRRIHANLLDSMQEILVDLEDQSDDYKEILVDVEDPNKDRADSPSDQLLTELAAHQGARKRHFREYSEEEISNAQTPRLVRDLKRIRMDIETRD